MRFDVLLVHAPSVYDFRHRDDIVFAYLGNSDSVHVSSIFEMPPVGVLALAQHLRRCGLRAEFFNVASRMLRDPGFDVEAFFRRAPADLFGVDLHWLAHAQGALELARRYKEIHPGAKVVVGGISASYYHEELVRYPQVDYVLRGYDTLVPLERLAAAKGDPDALRLVPNLTWKDSGAVEVNPLSYLPNEYTASVDWGEVFGNDRQGMTPYNVVVPQAGCEYACTWCGGSRDFYRKQFGVKGSVHKSPERLRSELASIAAASNGHTVTMIDFWHEYPALFEAGTAVFEDPAIRTVHYSLHRLPTLAKGRQMAASARAIIELSPDTHDDAIASVNGRGAYTMDEMESFIDALIDDVYSFELYFMIGLSGQTAESVWQTVDYCDHVLRKYRGRRVIPFLCPMLPFLDPGSVAFENSDRFGYVLRHRTLEDHRKALLSLHWRDRLNYETRWLDRNALVDVSYASVRALTELKAKHGQLPGAMAGRVTTLIDDAVALLGDVDRWQALQGEERASTWPQLGSKVRAYNDNQFKMVRSQQRPIDMGFSRRQWFDTEDAFERVLGASG